MIRIRTTSTRTEYLSPDTTLFRSYISVVNLARALDSLKEAGFWCLGLAGEAGQTLAASRPGEAVALVLGAERSEEHTSELQSLMRISYAVFCFTQQRTTTNPDIFYHVS